MLLSLSYLLNLIRDPNIASITPTSGFGIRRVCSKIDFGETRAVVEYGPATGVFTKYLLEHLPASATLVAIDTNENFLRILRERLPDPRLFVAHDSAENVRQILARYELESANYVISGIPFTMLPPDVADRIVQETYDLLVPGGKFLVYQFLKPEGANTRGIHQYLPRYFRQIRKEAEWLNIPPLWVYEATK